MKETALASLILFYASKSFDELWCGALFQLVMKIGPHGMAGEMGVILGVPQPFTVRSSRLTQAVCISHSHLVQILRSNTADANTVYANFVQHLKSLKEQVAADAPLFEEILSKTGFVSTVGNLHCDVNSETWCVTCLVCPGSASDRRHFSEAASER
jgi:hypothetical protein